MQKDSVNQFSLPFPGKDETIFKKRLIEADGYVKIDDLADELFD